METTGPLMELEPTTSTLRVRRATHCVTPPLRAVMSTIVIGEDTLLEVVLNVGKYSMKVQGYQTTSIS